MRAKQPREMSPFYNREFHAVKSAAEERLIFRWFQLLEKHHAIYNVLNKHDCLRADRLEKERARAENRPPRPIVIQPFPSVGDFYGCLVCGKYHACRLRRETCPLVIDKLDKRKSCAYSGQLLPIQDNLEVANMLDERCAEKEATLMSAPRYRKSSSSSSKSGKKVEKQQIMELFNEKKEPLRPLKRARPANEMNKEACQLLVANLYDLSIESVSLDGSSEDDDDEDGGGQEEEEEFCGGDELNFDGEEEEPVERKADYYDEDICMRHAKRQRIEQQSKEANTRGEDMTVVVVESTITANDKDWIISDHGGGGDDEEVITDGQGTEYENENGEGTHAKNYHNNIRYKNEYYAFLQHVIAKQKKTTTRQLSRYDRFIDVYARDMKEDMPVVVVTQAQEACEEEAEAEEEDDEEVELTEQQQTKEEEELSESVCEKIQSEVTIIVGILMAMDKTPRQSCTLAPIFIQERLVTYFVSLVKNITLLVYQSPVLNKVAMKRSAKNQSQTSKFAISVVDQESIEKPQSDAVYHEFTLCPRKIARSLLLNLFTEPLLIGDSQGYNITIWSMDKWLRLVVLQQGDSFLADYHRSSSSSPLMSVDNDRDRFCKEVTESAILVEKCLRYYRFCPLWLRAMVFQMSEPQ